MFVRSLALTTFIAILSATTGLASCDKPQRVSNESPPFIFRSLELSHDSSGGQRSWELSSPEASYELNGRIMRSRNPRGLLYSNSEPSYSISADSMTIVNDGELILLEGQVRIQQLRGKKITIRGGQLRWIPDKNSMLIEQRPTAADKFSRLVAKSARFHPEQQELEFLGPTKIDHWSMNKTADQSQKSDVVIWTNNGSWNLANGSLSASGPIRVRRGDKDQARLQWLEASRLSGNTVESYIDLIAPVVAVMPKYKSWLEAGTTRWWYHKQHLTTLAAFTAKIGEATVKGYGFRIGLKETTVEVLAGCTMQRSGERIQAKFCSWNWASGEISAKGDVELRRHSNNQVTQAQSLTGSAGGLKRYVQLNSSFGGRVKSKFTPARKKLSSKHQASLIEF